MKRVYGRLAATILFFAIALIVLGKLADGPDEKLATSVANRVDGQAADRVAAQVRDRLAALPAAAGEAERAADAFAKAATKAGATCRATHKQRTILCIVHATDRDTEDMAFGMVAQASIAKLPLQDWTLTLVNSGDYVVTLPFGDGPAPGGGFSGGLRGGYNP